MGYSVQDLYGKIFKIWRLKRHVLFREKVQPQPEDTLLDVGGFPNFWLTTSQPVARVDTLNLQDVTWDAAANPDYNIRPLVGNGCSLAFTDGSYDIGFSNSVIEHVGTWENQQTFAKEIRRVGRKVWVQTPAYECPFEPHFLTPFIHYLPRTIQKKIARHFTVWGILERPDKDAIDYMVETTRLLSKTEMKKLFPDCEILTERMLGIIPKSYIAVRLLS